TLLSADTDVIVLFTLRRRRIVVPTPSVLECGPIHPIKISAAGDWRCYGDRISDLDGFRSCIGGHGEIANRSGEIRRRIRRKRFHVERGGFALNRQLGSLAHAAKGGAEKRIGERII